MTGVMRTEEGFRVRLYAGGFRATKNAETQDNKKAGCDMLAQITAVIIFLVMFAMVITEKIERQYVTLGCGLATLVLVFGVCMRDWHAALATLNIRTVFTLGFWYAAQETSESTSGINWATIIFIAGMMVMVEGMAKAGFFRWLCMTIAKMVHFKTIPIFITFMIMSAVLAMFIDSITVILFLAAVTIELAQLLKFDPIPMILSEVFCANLGGSATMCGDPPNIIIGTSLGYSFGDFIVNTGLIGLVSLAFIVFYFYIVFRKQLAGSNETAVQTMALPDGASLIEDKKAFVMSSVIFGAAIILLVTHAQTGLTVATIGLLVAVVTLAAAGKSAAELLKKVDYKTLLFFIGLFIVVGGLEQTGILEMIAALIGKVSGGNAKLMLAIIIWVSGIASAFIDNIPFAATMIPVIKSLAVSQGVALPVLAWGLAMGTDIGGSATPIGASANVVGTAVATKAGYPVGWSRYCKVMAPATVIVLLISTVTIWLRYFG